MAVSFIFEAKNLVVWTKSLGFLFGFCSSNQLVTACWTQTRLIDPYSDTRKLDLRGIKEKIMAPDVKIGQANEEGRAANKSIDFQFMFSTFNGCSQAQNDLDTFNVMTPGH